MIPISNVELGPETEQLVLEVLRSGQLAQGPMVGRLEQAFGTLLGDGVEAIAVNNGTTALIAAAQVTGLSPGDEVVTSPFTFVATVNAALHAGATVRFADIGADDFNIDPDRLAEEITPRTKALIPVHLYGQAADMARIGALAEQHGLALIEDAAQAHGARFEGRAVGTFGIGCFSFYATKNLSTGEGGMVTTRDPGIADQLRLLRNQGMRARYQYEMAGNNYRLTDLQAAVALPQVAAYEANVAKRRRNASLLNEMLTGIDGLTTPETLAGRDHVWHQYTIRITDDASISRDALVQRLTDIGIGSGVYYPKVILDYACYRDHPGVVDAAVPVARQAAAEVLSLPVHPRLTEDDLEQVASAVRTALTGQP